MTKSLLRACVHIYTILNKAKLYGEAVSMALKVTKLEVTILSKNFELKKVKRK